VVQVIECLPSKCEAMSSTPIPPSYLNKYLFPGSGRGRKLLRARIWKVLNAKLGNLGSRKAEDFEQVRDTIPCHSEASTLEGKQGRREVRVREPGPAKGPREARHNSVFMELGVYPINTAQAGQRPDRRPQSKAMCTLRRMSAKQGVHSLTCNTGE
jgi:hypothetical protein